MPLNISWLKNRMKTEQQHKVKKKTRPIVHYKIPQICSRLLNASRYLPMLHKIIDIKYIDLYMLLLSLKNFLSMFPDGDDFIKKREDAMKKVLNRRLNGIYRIIDNMKIMQYIPPKIYAQYLIYKSGIFEHIMNQYDIPSFNKILIKRFNIGNIIDRLSNIKENLHNQEILQRVSILILDIKELIDMYSMLNNVKTDIINNFNAIGFRAKRFLSVPVPSIYVKGYVKGKRKMLSSKKTVKEAVTQMLKDLVNKNKMKLKNIWIKIINKVKILNKEVNELINLCKENISNIIKSIVCKELIERVNDLQKQIKNKDKKIISLENMLKEKINAIKTLENENIRKEKIIKLLNEILQIL